MVEKEMISAEYDDTRDREFNFADLLRSVWRKRVIVFSVIILAVLASLLYIGISKILGYENQTEYVIQFRFEGRDENRYPNGTPFSLGDIIAPAILAEIYQADKITDYGITFADFQSAITVSPYTPDRRLILDRYNQLDARRATTAEIAEAQSALQRELNTASTRYAVLRYTDRANGIPSSKAAELLVHIAQAWERVAIETRGVVQVDLETILPDVFSEQSVAGIERLNALRLLRENTDKLRGFVDELAKRPGGNRLRDSETGYTITTLRSKIDSTAVQLAEVPSNWPATDSATRTDTLGLPINLYSSSLFSEVDLQKMDYLIALDLLVQRSDLVRENTQRILNRPFGQVTKDPTTGLTAGDIQRLLAELNEFTIKQITAPVLSLGIAKNPDIVRLYYGSRLQELERQKLTLANKARVLEEANKNYQGLMEGTASASSEAPPSGTFPPGGSTVIPQFGDAFLDRIITLTQRGNDSEFRQKLVGDTVSLQQEAADIDSEIARIKDYLDRFGQASQDVSAQSASQRAFFIKELDSQLPEVLAKLKDFADVTQRIAYRLRFAEDIHSVTTANGESDRAIDYYLRDAAAPAGASISNILAELRKYAEVANRLYQQMSAVSLGSYQTLFKAASDPETLRPPLVTQFDVMLIGFAVFVGLTLGLIAALIALVFPERARKVT